MPKLLEEVYRLQTELTGLDTKEQLLLKMLANLLETQYEVQNPRNNLTRDEFMELPGRWELIEGKLYGD